MPNPEAKSNPSKRLPSASLATLRYIVRGCLLGLTPVSIHTQFRSSFSLTMVTSRHLSTFSLQTPPSPKMPLVLWLFFAQTPMPMPTPTSTTCSSWRPSNQYVPSPTSSTTAVSLYRSVALARIPHSTRPSSSKTEWISEFQLAEYSSLFIEYDNKQQILAPSSGTFEQGRILSSGRHSRRQTKVEAEKVKLAEVAKGGMCGCAVFEV